LSALHVASWNVHGCVGSDGRADGARVAAVIEALDADVVALQEVLSDEVAGGPLDQAGQLAALTGLTPAYGPTLLRAGAAFGNLVLTRLPLAGVVRHDLSVARREPRGALDVVLAPPERPRVRLVATHLGLAAGERRAQAARLLASLDAPPQAPLIVAGDFNEWRPWAPARRWLRRRLGRAPAPATFPARWPVVALDRIYATAGATLLELRVVASAAARAASDHLPLVARVEIASA